MRYLVAIDGGPVSEAAFKTVCSAMRKEDDLIIVHIVRRSSSAFLLRALWYYSPHVRRRILPRSCLLVSVLTLPPQVPDMAKKYAVTALEHAPAVSVVSHEAQESINERGKKLLDTYIRRAKEAGIVSLKGVLVRCAPAPHCLLTLHGRHDTLLTADVP